MPDESDGLDGEISLLDLALMVSDRWRTVTCITASSAIMALVVSLFLTQRFTATVTLLPPKPNESLALNFTAQPSLAIDEVALLSGRGDIYQSNEMYVAMLQSRAVEDAVIARFDLMRECHCRRLSDARRFLENHVEIDGDTSGGFLRIDVDDKDPIRAANIASGYVDEFRNLWQQLAITQAARRQLFLERQLEQARGRLESAEEALKETEQTTAIINVDSQAGALIQAAATLRGRIAVTETQIRGMRTYASDGNARLQEAQEELKTMRTELAQLGGSEVSDNDLLIPKGKLTEAALEYADNVREVKYYERIYETLSGQMEVAKLDRAKQGSVVQVVDPASPADKRSFPQRGSIVLGAGIVGLLAGISYALCAAGIDYLLSQPESHAKLNYLTYLVSRKRAAGADGPAR